MYGVLILECCFCGIQIFLKQNKSNDSSPAVKKPPNDALLAQVRIFVSIIIIISIMMLDIMRLNWTNL